MYLILNSQEAILNSQSVSSQYLFGSIGPRTLKKRGRPEGAPIGPDYLRFASLRRISARSSLRLNLISSTSLRLDSPESLEAALALAALALSRSISSAFSEVKERTVTTSFITRHKPAVTEK